MIGKVKSSSYSGLTVLTLRFDCCFFPSRLKTTKVLGDVSYANGDRSFASNKLMLRLAFSHIPSLFNF